MCWLGCGAAGAVGHGWWDGWWECEKGFTFWQTGSFSKIEQCYHAADPAISILVI